MNTDNYPQSRLRFPNVFTFDDITQLPSFEDAVARDIHRFDRIAHIQAWQGRVALRDAIRPPRFNGSIRNIEMAAMEDPYDRLLDVSERGWKLQNGMSSTARRDIESARKNTRGFVFRADAHSSGRGVIGQIQAEIWYIRVPQATDGRLKLSNAAGSPVGRRITKPKLETEEFITADETAKRIGFGVIRRNMMHPLQGGLPRA